MPNSYFAALAIVLASTSCMRTENVPSGRMADCVPIGNDARRTFCALTYSQLLSNPEGYNNRRIFIQAWAVRKGNEVLLFPSIDSYEGGETYASLKLDGGRLMDNYWNTSAPVLNCNRHASKWGGYFC